MKKKAGFLFYIVMISVFSLLIYFIINKGHTLETKAVVQNSKATILNDAVQENHSQPLPVLLLQVVVIIGFVRFFGFVFKKTGQPAVIGEIIAGIVLGPSILGAIAPALSAFIFPANSLGNLQFLSQVGLILFMFIIGLESDFDIIRKQATNALIISHASIIIPYTFGMALALYMYRSFAPQGISFLPFSLFMGIAMSITAFPVLARIIKERKLTKTPLGIMAITCAAADDATAWCILAFLIGIIKSGTSVYAINAIALLLCYILIMFFVIKPALNKLLIKYGRQKIVGKSVTAIIFLLMLLSAYTTEVIGIHALFGAFLAGVIMPNQPGFRQTFINKIEDISMVLLLPLFFVYTGLRTQINLLNESSLWATYLLVVLIAIAGKFGGSAIAARITGQSWQNSLSIGALMNTRGLMELIVLNIGYDLGILSPQVFTIMVLMALLTTLLTNPALNFINKFFYKG